VLNKSTGLKIAKTGIGLTKLDSGNSQVPKSDFKKEILPSYLKENEAELIKTVIEESIHYPRVTLNAHEAADYLGISYWQILEMAKRGIVPHSHAGKRVLFRIETLTKWLDEQEAISVYNKNGVIS
jgi:excisionase family DNA binding protein